MHVQLTTEPATVVDQPATACGEPGATHPAVHAIRHALDVAEAFQFEQLLRGGLLGDAEQGVGLLSSQKYDVHSALRSGDTQILRLTWTGELRTGRQLTAHIAQFVETRDGLINSIETFDCYEPF